jgi:Zn-dependent metalloprotease
VKFLRQGIALGLVGAGLAVAPLTQAVAEPAAATAAVSPDDAIKKMRKEASGSVAVAIERSNQKVGFIRTKGQADLLPSMSGDSTKEAVDKSTAYVEKYAGAFGATPSQLSRSDVSRDRHGWTVTFTQSVRGVPVFGGELKAHVDEGGDLTSVNGFAAPAAGLSTTPAKSASAAAARAVASVRSMPEAGMRRGDQPAVAPSGLTAETPELVVYRLGSTRGIPGESILAYTTVVASKKLDVREFVILDANTLKVVNRWSLIDHDLERHLYEAAGSTDPSTFTNVWNEGNPFPDGLDQWQANEVDYTGDAYWLFENTFGRDSYDGLGHSMTTVNNDGRINCPNANWNGQTTNYCDGTATDDVVAHEWGHAYTEYTGNMIYQWQPGALNESMSDVWGETVDLVNGKDDADEGDITSKRPDGQCSSHSPAAPVVVINSPASIAKICAAGAASFGPQLDATGITGDVVLGTDNDPNDGSDTNACTPLTNGGDVSGNIALVDRGTCAFTVKVKNAQDAGAIAVIVADNVEAYPSGMGGSDPSITIPSLRIRLSDGNLIKAALPGVNVTMSTDPSPTTDSYRWLMGEDATAFNGAIRDMWSPTCYGDPGKVSDEQYYCASDDGGGVHENSGVPNHTYALAVDGGSYNGHTVTALGLDKAANIWWRAESEYLTPTSDFTAMADALEASCADLTGQPINQVTVAPNATPTAADPIAAADCSSLHTAILATEMRTEPTQCAFQPLLDPDAPDVCGAGTKRKTVWKEDFEHGLRGWKAHANSVFGGPTFPWKASRSAPGGHAGGVAYGPAPDLGDCSGTATDISSSDQITSAVIRMPRGRNMETPRLTFDHYVATEFGWDGGNVKISVNGGAFEAIPYTAYTFNEPWYLNSAAEGNTNPLAGEDAFTGTDGGKVTGSWGQSQVDLEALGVQGGDRIRIQLDMGRDGCGGLDGWYVDNLSVSVCKAKHKNHPKGRRQA